MQSEFPNLTRVINRPMIVKNEMYQRAVRQIELFIMQGRTSRNITQGEVDCYNKYIARLRMFKQLPNFVMDYRERLQKFCRERHPVNEQHDRQIEVMFQYLKEITEYSNALHSVKQLKKTEAHLNSYIGNYYSNRRYKLSSNQ